MSKTLKWLIGVPTLCLGAVLIFQNCGKSFQHEASLGDDNHELGEPTPTPTPVNQLPPSFKAGMDFKRDLLGNLLSESLDANLDKTNYEMSDAAKGLAIAGNGIAFAAAIPGVSQLEVERVVVEACNVLSGSPCALIVSENKFILDPVQIGTDAQMLITDEMGPLPTSGMLPMNTDPVALPTYLGTRSTTSGYTFKALALAPDNQYFVSFGKTQSEANRRALNRCAFESAFAPCLIYAEGREKVFLLSAWNREMYLRLSPAPVIQHEVPFVLDDHRDKLSSFFSNVNEGYVGVLALSSKGALSYAVDVTTEVAREKAMKSCKALDPDCQVYSELKNVVMSVDDLPFAASTPRALVCGHPMASCEAFAERGCPAGERWVLNLNGIQKVNCR